MIDVNELKFDKDGLIPAVVVDSITKKVLTVAYMNKESLEISMEKGLTCFFSRSRQKLWLKGETSGNYQHIVSITADCDNDALVVVVEKTVLHAIREQIPASQSPFGRVKSLGSFLCRDFTIFLWEEKKICPRVLTQPIFSRRESTKF